MRPLSPLFMPDYDLLADTHIRNPYPLFAQMRVASPVYWSPQLRAWVLTRHDDIAAVLRHPSLSSALFHGQGFPHNEVTNFMGRWLVMQDPPDHTALRAHLAPTFAARHTATLRDTVAARADILLATLDPATVSWYDDFAFPLTAYWMAALLGIPPEACDRLQEWSHALGSLRRNEPFTRAERAVAEMREMFEQLAADRESQPTDDLVGLLYAAMLDPGTHFTAEDLVSNAAFLLFVGHDPTARVMALTLTALQNDPTLLDTLPDDDATISNMVEEGLRVFTSVAHVTRIATAPLTVGDAKIKTGERLLLMLVSANRDEATVQEGEALNWHREHPRHLSFGLGPHYCLGAALTRLQLTITIRSFLAWWRTHRPLMTPNARSVHP